MPTSNQSEIGRTDRPTNEMTAKVVAKWKGWGYEPRIEHGSPLLNEGLRRWQAPLADRTGNDADLVLDPRDDTDAALELFHWVIEKFSYDDELERQDDGWIFWPDPEGDGVKVPISGQPFRHAVVGLAARVLGVDEVSNGDAQ